MDMSVVAYCYVYFEKLVMMVSERVENLFLGGFFFFFLEEEEEDRGGKRAKYFSPAISVEFTED